MKKLTAYYLILLYACSLAKPLAVWFADVMAHGYFGHSHTAVVHREGGRNHVHYQMNKAAKDDAPEQKNTAPKNNEDVTVASFIESPLRTDGFVMSERSVLEVAQLPAVFLSVQGPPPRAFPA